MFLLRKIGQSIDGLLDRICAVAGAALFSQAPQLMRQYQDVLAGALAEAQRNIEVFRTQAQLIGRTMEELLDKHLRSPDPDFQATGRVMRAALERYDDYAAAYEALSTASIWERPFVFLAHFDWKLWEALEFRPALPLDAEGAVYAFLGVLFGMAVYHGVLRLPLTIYQKVQRRKEIQAEARRISAEQRPKAAG